MSSNGRSPAETAEEWWERNEPIWRENPDYYENLRIKAERHGKEWVRRNKNVIDAYWRNAQELYAAQAWMEEHGSLDDW
jgi:hypothetical protein